MLGHKDGVSDLQGGRLDRADRLSRRSDGLLPRRTGTDRRRAKRHAHHGARRRHRFRWPRVRRPVEVPWTRSRPRCRIRGASAIISNPKAKNVLRALPNGRFVAVVRHGQRHADGAELARRRGDARQEHEVDQHRGPRRQGAVEDRQRRAPATRWTNPLTSPMTHSTTFTCSTARRSSIFVFGAGNKLVSTLTIPNNSPGCAEQGRSARASTPLAASTSSTKGPGASRCINEARAHVTALRRAAAGRHRCPHGRGPGARPRHPGADVGGQAPLRGARIRAGGAVARSRHRAAAGKARRRDTLDPCRSARDCGPAHASASAIRTGAQAGFRAAAEDRPRVRDRAARCRRALSRCSTRRRRPRSRR